MTGTFQAFEPAYTFIDGKLDTFLNTDASNVIAQVSGPMRAALVLYVLLYGVAILRGAIAEPIVDFAVRSLKLTVIYTLATTVAYSSWVTTPLFQTMPNALSQALGGSASTDPGAAFDQFFARAAYLGEKISATANVTNPAPWLEAGAVDVIGGLAAALGFGVVIVAKVSLALIIALGPIFIACSLFDVSRRFFFGWLSQAVNYLVLMALIVAVFQMILSLVGEQWSAIDGGDPAAGGLLFIALSVLGAIFFLQTPAIASGIAGGASSGLSDFAVAAGMAFRGAPRLPNLPQPDRRRLRAAIGRLAPTCFWKIMMRLTLHLPTLAFGLAMLSACASAGEPKLAVCDGKHRRPANPYGSVLTTTSAAAPPASTDGPSVPPAAPISPVGPRAMIDARSLRPCGADA